MVKSGQISSQKSNRKFTFICDFNYNNSFGCYDSLKINSICKFEFVDSVRSKNIDQNDLDLVLELFTIEVLKNKENFEINLIFSDNAYITLSTEIVEVTLEDQNKIQDFF